MIYNLIEGFWRQSEAMTGGQFGNVEGVWNERFNIPEFLFGTEPNVYLARHGGLVIPGTRALAMADGEGLNNVLLARQDLLVDAFDISSVAVDKTRKLGAWTITA